MSVEEIIKWFADECWVIDIKSMHPENGKTVYEMRAVCGVQARGRVRVIDQSFEAVVRLCYEQVLEKFGNVGEAGSE